MERSRKLCGGIISSLVPNSSALLLLFACSRYLKGERMGKVKGLSVPATEDYFLEIDNSNRELSQISLIIRNE